MKSKIESICGTINSRIKSMDYATEKAVRDYFEDEKDEDGFITPNEYDAIRIAEILDVNNEFIFSIFKLF